MTENERKLEAGRKVKIRDMTALSEYRRQMLAHPRLVYLALELTDQCNLSCLHCGSSCGNGGHTQLAYEQIVKLLDSVVEKTAPRRVGLCFTGGEPLLHKDFLRIAAYSRQKGFRWGITTNGTLISEQMARDMLEAGMGAVSISLDGLEKSHDALRSVPGAFQRAVAGLRNLKKYAGDRVFIQVTSVFHRENLHELGDLYQFLTELDVKSWRVINMEPIGRALEHPELLLAAEDYRYLLDFIQEKRFSSRTMDVTYGCSHYLTPVYERMVRNEYFICGSGLYCASVLCNGDIFSCLDIERRPELIQGNIASDDFMDVWEHRFQAFREDRAERCELCRNCADRAFCNGDSTHTWDFDRNQPRLCLKQMLEAETETAAEKP